MERREYLTTISGGSAIILAGCSIIGGEDQNTKNSKTPRNEPSIPENMTVSQLYDDSNFINNQYNNSEDRGFEFQEEDWKIFDHESMANEALVEKEEVNEFIEETGFNISYLLLVRNGMQSAPDLTLQAIERSGDGLLIIISITDNPGGDDLTIHSLLIRITDQESGVPEEILLEINGYV